MTNTSKHYFGIPTGTICLPCRFRCREVLWEGEMGWEADWRAELDRFLEPFAARLGHRARRAMGSLHVAGLIGPGDRKSVQPMAARLGLRSHDALHHVVSAGSWNTEPLGAEWLAPADRLVGGPEAVLLVEGEPARRTRSRRRAPLRSAAPRSLRLGWARAPTARRWCR